ncbi:Uncharacterised protein [Mycobacterium tuberculosis]|nr:Uncharacterised protein [Mycobacterium tuberculosis]
MGAESMNFTGAGRRSNRSVNCRAVVGNRSHLSLRLMIEKCVWRISSLFVTDERVSRYCFGFSRW